jgi:antitoxin (DNA-binding transcriptional repressor) of toxin-antitoxin stability system
MPPHDSKTHFFKPVDIALSGDEAIIAKSGKPLLRLTPLDGKAAPRAPGLSRGKVWMADDLDAPLPEEVAEEFGR